MGCDECDGCIYSSAKDDDCCPVMEASDCTSEMRWGKDRVIKVALVGNANVGKSVIFNQMTGLDQTIGNWAGKTVELKRGKLAYGGRLFELIDLPGVYSLSSYTEEEAVTRDYLASEEVDVVLYVADSTALERNLYLTTQVLEMGLPLVVALNKSDMARKNGIDIDASALAGLLGVPVIETIGTTGQGLGDAIEMARRQACRGKGSRKEHLEFEDEVEARVDILSDKIETAIQGYAPRFLASKLLEGDELAATLVASSKAEVLDIASRLQDELSGIKGEESSTVITSARYSLSNRISESVTSRSDSVKATMGDRLDRLTTHPVAGYVILILVMLGVFLTIFTLGDLISGYLMSVYEWGGAGVQDSLGDGWAYRLIWDGGVQGLIAAIAFVLPYILPFYLFLALMEDSGYLARVAVLMDASMHRFGLHGKAFIPLILGYGCSVPAVLGTRILDTRREKLITGFLATLIPCAARTIVIMALVGAFLGWYWALAFYAFNIIVVVILGKVSARLIPGKNYGMIMEVPKYHTPNLKIVLRQTWMRLKDFMVVAMPVIIIGSVLLVFLEVSHISTPLNDALSPVTVWVLGLPVSLGLILILGIFRKELTIVMLFALMRALNHEELVDFITTDQMVVFTLFVMFYIPCISTLAAMYKEYGLKPTAWISAGQFMLALLIAGMANWLLSLI